MAEIFDGAACDESFAHTRRQSPDMRYLFYIDSVSVDWPAGRPAGTQSERDSSMSSLSIRLSSFVCFVNIKSAIERSAPASFARAIPSPRLPLPPRRPFLRSFRDTRAVPFARPRSRNFILGRANVITATHSLRRMHGSLMDRNGGDRESPVGDFQRSLSRS